MIQEQEHAERRPGNALVHRGAPQRGDVRLQLLDERNHQPDFATDKGVVSTAMRLSKSASCCASQARRSSALPMLTASFRPTRLTGDPSSRLTMQSTTS